MPEDIISLQRSVSHLRNWVLLLTIGWAATVSGWLLLRLPSQVHAAQPQNLRVRRLAVVDENGTERVVIAAPLPEPIIHGVKGMLAQQSIRSRYSRLQQDGAPNAALRDGWRNQTHICMPLVLW